MFKLKKEKQSQLKLGHIYNNTDELLAHFTESQQNVGSVVFEDIVKDQLLSLPPIMSAPSNQDGCQLFPELRASPSQSGKGSNPQLILISASCWYDLIHMPIAGYP